MKMEHPSVRTLLDVPPEPLSDVVDAVDRNGAAARNAARKQRAQQLLFQASQDASIAIDHARRGRNIEALRAWRALFGPKFPLS